MQPDVPAPDSAAVPEDLLRPVVEHFRPVKVVLFGSHARGEAGPDSDVDLFVVLDDHAPPEALGWRARFEARRNWHRAVDIVTCRRAVYEAKRRLPGTLSHTADAEGVVVYERR